MRTDIFVLSALILIIIVILHFYSAYTQPDFRETFSTLQIKTTIEPTRKLNVMKRLKKFHRRLTFKETALM